MAVSGSAIGRGQGQGALARALTALHIDPPLLLGIGVLAALGGFVLYSAGGESLELTFQHGLRFGIGLVAMLVVAQIPPRNLRLWTPWLYVVGLGALTWVLVAGEMGGGARRWIDLGLTTIQPSEGMKVIVPMMVAWYLGDRAMPPSLARVLVASVIILVPAVMVARQPDLGTAVLIGCAGGFVLFLAGLRWRLIAAIAVAAAASVPLVWSFMHGYQRQRLMTFLDPQNDPLGAGYHIIQSQIAVGSGGLYGKGWLNGSQSHLDFLPERSTDFVFAVYGEEFGLFGGVLLLLIYAFLVGRGLYLSTQAEQSYGRLLGGALALTFFIYAFINIGMVTGLLPVVGVPLPLVSYGGTSMVTLLVAFGIIMSVCSHKRLLAQ